MTLHRTLLNEPTQDEGITSNVTSISPINICEASNAIKESSTSLNILQNVKKPKTLTYNPLLNITGPYPFSASPKFQ